MNLLHVTDLGNGQIQVAWQRDNDISRSYPHPIHFASPLGDKDRAELRWYLEDYLQFPYGAEDYRAQQVEQSLAKWGESLFKQVFVKGEPDPDPRAFYQEAIRDGLGQCELCFTSEDAAFLNVPWELMRDPAAGRGYLAPLLGGLYRHRTGHKIEAPLPTADGEPFRILLVIARPYGERDVPLGTIARPMLEALRPLRPRIELEVLRPPTFNELQQRLNAQPGHYQLVHFDGHGVFAHSPANAVPGGNRALGERGHLVFENEDGAEHIVSSQELGQMLANCRVPLFVLNACRSAEEGQADPFSSVAAQLIAIGAKGVVAMSYSVYADAAARFMGSFYERLAEHVPLAQAVAEARRRLFSEPERVSVAGNLELQDWLVPALYQQELRFVPIPSSSGTAKNEGQSPEITLRQKAAEVCPEGQFGFVGRDHDLHQIERALRDDHAPWALLSGIGGIGKTELAFGFARWYAETGGCPGGVFATSFKRKADFGQVIGSIAGFGTDFSRLPEEEQFQQLVAYLLKNPSLLVWDNFEPVAGYPDGELPLATDQERLKLVRFLKALRGGPSRVLITSRKPDERWLGLAYALVEIRGLNDRDCTVLAQAILKTVGRQPSDFRQDPDYSRLIGLLGGHPRSLEVALPQLRQRRPAEMIDALQHRVDQLGEAMEDASLGDAFTHLSDKARRHLPCIGLFTSYVDADTVSIFVGLGGVAEDAYTALVGERLDTGGWEAVLDEASGSGLVRSLGQRVYELHPTLPTFFRRQLMAAIGESGLGRLDEEFVEFYATWAATLLESTQNSQPDALGSMSIEEANLLRALRRAEMSEKWWPAQTIAQTLNVFYETTGRVAEWRALWERLNVWVGRELAVDAGQERANMWLFLLGAGASAALARNESEAAEDAYQRTITYLISLNDPALEPRIAPAYHQLGLIAQEREQFNQAEQWYQKALAIYQRLGLEALAADDYHQLGMVAQEQLQFDQAEHWYQQSLAILKRLGLERAAAADYHQLGRLAEERQQFPVAKRWYRQALKIRERLGLEGDAASDYHQLGVIAEKQKQFDQATHWYRQALAITERLGLERESADACHQLGSIAFEKQQFDQAEQWYRRALAITERLGPERRLATIDHSLGRVAQERQQFDQAEQLYRQALAIFARIGHPPDSVITLAQLGVLMRAQQRLEAAVDWSGRALAIAAQYKMPVARQIMVDLARCIQVMGEDAFVAAWRKHFQQAPPMTALRNVLLQLAALDG